MRLPSHTPEALAVRLDAHLRQAARTALSERDCEVAAMLNDVIRATARRQAQQRERGACSKFDNPEAHCAAMRRAGVM